MTKKVRKAVTRRGLSVWILACSVLSIVAAGVAPRPDEVVSVSLTPRFYASLALEILSWAAVPIAAWLVSARVKLIEKQPNAFYPLLWQYAGMLTILALVCEAPYDFSRTGTWWSVSSQNPITALVIALLARIVWQTVKNMQGAVRVALRVLIIVDALVAAFAVQTLLGVVVMALVFMLWPTNFTWQWRRLRVSRALAIICGAVMSGITPLVGVWLVGHIKKAKPTRHSLLGRWFLWWAYPVLLVVCALVRLVIMKVVY